MKTKGLVVLLFAVLLVLLNGNYAHAQGSVIAGFVGKWEFPRNSGFAPPYLIEIEDRGSYALLKVNVCYSACEEFQLNAFVQGKNLVYSGGRLGNFYTHSLQSPPAGVKITLSLTGRGMHFNYFEWYREVITTIELDADYSRSSTPIEPIEPKEPASSIGPIGDTACNNPYDDRNWLDKLTGVKSAYAAECTEYVRSTVQAIKNCWGASYPDAGLWDNWARDPKISGKCGWTVNPLHEGELADFSKARPGDIVVWNTAKENGGQSCAGADPPGHVAVFQKNNNDGTIGISGSNWRGDQSRVRVDPRCMSFIHVSQANQPPMTAPQSQPTSWWDRILHFFGLK